MDNYFKMCPANMSDGRLFTDYRSATRREQYNKAINGFVRDDEYRLFLQNNGATLMDRTWDYTKKHNSCHPNVCIHTAFTRSSPREDYEEMQLYNNVREGKPTKISPKCHPMPDYRLTVTPGSKLNHEEDEMLDKKMAEKKGKK